MNCIIVDDEPLAISALENHISKVEALHLIGTYQNAPDAFMALQQQTIDLMFLDIQMPQMTGLELLRSLKNPPKVILCTAYRDFALEGFELDVLDYLVKPISFPRFLKAVSKLFEKAIPTSSISRIEPKETERSFLYVKADRVMEKIWLDELLLVEGLKNYVKLKTIDREIITYHSISQIAEKLSSNKFLRVHKSFLVAIDKIERFSSTHLEIQKHYIPIGRFYKKGVQDVLDKFSI